MFEPWQETRLAVACTAVRAADVRADLVTVEAAARGQDLLEPADDGPADDDCAYDDSLDTHLLVAASAVGTGPAGGADADGAAADGAGQDGAIGLGGVGSVSADLWALEAALGRLAGQVPADLPAAVALADAARLVRVQERLRAVVLARLADIDLRQLWTQDGATSTGTWLLARDASADRGEVALARKLHRTPHLAHQVLAGALSVAAAVKVGQALDKVRRHVDRPDGTIDGIPSDQVIRAVVIDGVLDRVCEARGGLTDTDPLLASLHERLTGIDLLAASELGRLEQALTLLAQHVTVAQLSPALTLLIDALLPVQLEDRVERGHRDRGLTLVRNPDGSGWHLPKTHLSLECGELLWTVLAAARATDPANVTDTAAHDAGRAFDLTHDGWRNHGQPHPAELPPDPRSRAARTHDALTLALRALLDAGSLGSRDKTAPHLTVTTSLTGLHDQPGTLPARSGSGSSLPGGLVRQWLCDSHLTRTVLSLGRRVLETSHTERTLKAHERRALTVQWGGQCAGAGCTHTLATGHTLTPHHATPWALCHSTSWEDTVPLCDQTHHDLHTSNRTLRLKDGRWLSPTGWVPPPPGHPDHHRPDPGRPDAGRRDADD